MKGWLLDTNVVAALINPNGAPSVKGWARDQREDSFFISILTLAEYDKGIHNLTADHPDRPRYKAARDALDDVPAVTAAGKLPGEPVVPHRVARYAQALVNPA